VPYSQNLSASGGTPPYNWSITAGTLSGGLTLSGAGLLSGTPTNAGDFNFTVQVMDSASATATKAFTVRVNPPALIIASGSPFPAGTVGVAYSQTLTASGGQPPYDWAVSAGLWTGGLTLSGAGVLSGTPASEGTFTCPAQRW